MGKVRMTGGGMTNAGSDDCTLLRSSVPMGAKAITADSNDEAVEGTLDIGRADASSYDVLEGVSFIDYGYESDGTTVLHLTDGAMPDNGSVYAELNCGEYYVIPRGFHNGLGDVYATGLDLQTGGATAEDRYVLSGKTYWKDGVKRTGAMTVSSVVSFSVAAYSMGQVLATWTNPAGPYSGFAICGKAGGYPTSIWDSRVYTGGGSNNAADATNTATIGALTPGTVYYFRIWVYLGCSAGEQYSAGFAQTTATPTAHGRQAFTSSGIFIVPAGVRNIDIHSTGGGGGGANGTTSSGGSGGDGGGGGEVNYQLNFGVTPGEKINVTVGSGGGGGGAPDGEWRDGEAVGGSNGSQSSTRPGNNRTFGGTAGAKNIRHPYYELRSGGGSGGGQGSKGNYSYPGNGGSNGSNGYMRTNTNEDRHVLVPIAPEGAADRGFQGSGVSTREFGTGTLYSGGGGGGTRWSNYAEKYRSIGGAGGGGDGTWQYGAAKPGGAGTGGGGGGGGRGNLPPMTYEGAAGGSGNVIIRW